MCYTWVDQNFVCNFKRTEGHSKKLCGKKGRSQNDLMPDFMIACKPESKIIRKTFKVLIEN